ncbi:mkrn1 [Symbiodinium natans]|uniref:Mkrn1 protein n=1 Tax=Symbiodinium natans TaxID=878477 RepID=A0A812M4A6_9DINO|nr:mkrn1 [Symbiodinium natans]
MGAAGSVHPEGQNPDWEDSTNQRHEAPSPPSDGNPSHGQRTVCRDFAKGHCKYGDRCRYLHEDGGGGGGTSSHSKTLCREFVKGHCKYGDRCRYSHDQGGTPGDRSHIPCRQFAKGNCVFGDRCRYSHDDPEDKGGEIHIPISSVHLVTRPQLSYEEAVQMLSTALTDSTNRLHELDAERQELLDETSAMDPEERTRSMGTVWQYRGRSKKAERWHAFKEHDSQRVEEEYQRWVAEGRPKDHSKCRFEMALEGGMRVSLDFHLGTQITVGKGGRRGLQRTELPSKARKRCEPFFQTVQGVVGDVCGKLEEVSGQLAGMDISEESQLAELQRLERDCVEALRESVKTFVELSVFVSANELLQKLEAVLGEKHAASLGVAAGGRDMRVETVCEAVKQAFAIRAYGKGLLPGQTAWDKLKPLIFSGKKFYDQSMLRIRESMVKFRSV